MVELRARDPVGAAERDSLDPAQPQFRVPRKDRPAARRPQMVDTGMSHIGFRCVRDLST